METKDKKKLQNRTVIIESGASVKSGLLKFCHMTSSAFLCTHLMSSSLAKMMTTLAFGFSLSLRTILSNSPGFGSRGIFTDWEMHRPPELRTKKERFVKLYERLFWPVLVSSVTPMCLKSCIWMFKCFLLGFNPTSLTQSCEVFIVDVSKSIQLQ